jgi:serine/threonine-protein phosphatase 2A regulatory subunit A
MLSDEAKVDAQRISELIDELRHNDLQTRLAAFRKLTVIAQALGATRTREELVPYLNEFIDDEDEVLLVLVDELGALQGYVGGTQNSYALLSPLEALGGVEEAAVREKAMGVMVDIINALSPDLLEQYVVPLLRRLLQNEWFTSRMSACGLFTATYPRLSPELQQEMRAAYTGLCSDEMPMVRRSACAHLPNFLTVMSFEFVRNEMTTCFLKITKDEQDSVRLLSVKVCVTMVELYREQGIVQKMIPTVLTLSMDKSWRVRYMVADKFRELCEAMGEDQAQTEAVIDRFASLLQDNEPEVRTAAVLKLGEVSRCFGPMWTLKKIMIPVKALVKDQCQYTKAALGSTIMSLAGMLKKKDVYDHLLPVFLQLLKDPNPEVRLNIIAKLDSLNEVMGVEVLSQSLLPAICELALDQKWRVRLAIIEHIPLLARQLGHEFFETKLSDLCMNWLGDQVHSIREAATQNLSKLVNVFGVEWATKHILPKIVNLGNHKSYLYRMTAVLCIKDMAKNIGQGLTTEVLLPVVLRLAPDPVPNVRFNVARTLGAIAPEVTADSLKTRVVPALLRLQTDTDTDVSYFATESLALIRNMMQV